MTSPSYAWPRHNLLANGSFENTTGTTTNFTKWEEEGAVTRAAVDTAGDGGSYSAVLGEQMGVYQTGQFVTAAKGRYLDQLDPYLLTLFLDNVFGEAWVKVQAFLLDSNDVLKYSYDFAAGKWVAMATSAVMNDGKAHWIVSDAGGATQHICPRIEAPVSAGVDVTDSYKMRIRIYNDAPSSATVYLDGVVLSTWAADVRMARLGRYVTAWNGYNYPVKYDTQSGTISELSLHPPYVFPAVPTSSATTGGSLANSKFFGVAYTFVAESGEESAAPLGVGEQSGYFTTGTGASDTKINIDFSTVTLPNTEEARTTDNDEIVAIRVYRTVGYDTEADAATAARTETGLHFEGQLDILSGGTVAPFGTFAITLSDEDLLKQSEWSIQFDPSRAPAPLFTVGAVHRNRLWVGGGRTYRMGEISVTADQRYVDGTEVTAAFTDAATYWNRGVGHLPMHVLQVDGDTQTYDVEEYAYPADSGTSTNPERLYLTGNYEGTTASSKKYTLRPTNGRVYYSEEGRPYQFSWAGYFQLDGADGEAVTGIVPAQTAILSMTRRATFVFNYEMSPYDIPLARPISRTLGCIAPNSPVEIRGVAYWLSAEGVVRSDGTRVEVISNAIQDMFTDPDDPDYIVRESWSQMASMAQGIHFPQAQQYLLAVKTKNGKHGCDLILAYNYFFESWDIFRLTTGLVRWSEAVDTKGNDILLFTDDYGQVYRWDAGHVDGVGEVNNHGALSGTVASSTALSFTPSETATLYTTALSNNFTSATLGLEGAWVKIVDGTGLGQKRRISHVTSGKVFLHEKWATNPDTTSVWELGGIDFEWNLKRSNLGLPGRPKTIKFLNVDQKPQSLGGQAEVRYFQDSADYHHLEAEGLEVARFPTGLARRVKARGDEATGYAIRVQVRLDGPEKPIEVWNLSAPLVIKQEDR